MPSGSSMNIRVATHNMGDTGKATRLGAIIGWTEKNRRQVRALSKRTAMKHSMPRRAPKGLAISWDPRKFKKSKIRPIKVHGGIAKLTPGRGYIVMTGKLENGRKSKAVSLHFINNAFGPVKRHGRRIRRRLWLKMFRNLQKKIKAWEANGYVVILLGDFNRHDQDFLPPLKGTRRAVGSDRAPYDRIFVSEEVEVRKVYSGKKNGSDHNSEIAQLTVADC